MDGVGRGGPNNGTDSSENTLSLKIKKDLKLSGILHHLLFHIRCRYVNDLKTSVYYIKSCKFVSLQPLKMTHFSRHSLKVCSH